MSTIAFRFDVDTHKCIRDGVEHLLALSSKYEAPFTFFLNTGCSIDLKHSLHTLQHPLREKPPLTSAPGPNWAMQTIWSAL